MVKVLIVDQFSGITPYSLSNNPTKFDALVERALAEHTPTTAFPFLRKPEITDVDEATFVPEMCTTVIRPNANGFAEAWRWRWDSSD